MEALDRSCQLNIDKDHPAPRKVFFRDLCNLGITEGETILLDPSLKSIGWVNGRAETVISALLDVLGDNGTLVAPTHTGDNSDPANWRSPPVPPEWWQTIRETMPVHDPRTSQTRAMGVIPELLRTWPGAMRSGHPQTSFAAVRAKAKVITTGHSLDCQLGENSPVIRLEEINARVLLLGTGFDTCTAFHLAEYRNSAALGDNSFAVMEDGFRQWMTVKDVCLDDRDFLTLGSKFEATGAVTKGLIGAAECKLFPVSEAVSFATEWMRRHRNNQRE